MFCKKTESSRLLYVLSPLYLAYYSCVQFANDDQNIQRAQRKMGPEFAFLTLGSFLQTFRHGITTRYHGDCIQQACEGRGTLVPLNKRIWTLLGVYGIVSVLSCFDMERTRGLLALARKYKVTFNVNDGLGWVPYECTPMTAKLAGAFLLRRRYVSTTVKRLTEGWRLEFAELAVCSFKNGGSDIHSFPVSPISVPLQRQR